MDHIIDIQVNRATWTVFYLKFDEISSLDEPTAAPSSTSWKFDVFIHSFVGGGGIKYWKQFCYSILTADYTFKLP